MTGRVSKYVVLRSGARLGQPKRSKMGNKPVWECGHCGRQSHTGKGKLRACVCGHTLKYFASKREFNRWHELKQLEKAGQIRNLRRQVSYRLEVNGRLICTYIADAVYEENQHIGKHGPFTLWLPVVEDSKGHATPVYKLKAKLMAAGACPEFPQGIDIRET